MMKKIAINCQAAATAALEDLIPLQGGLKKLENEKYKKLKRSLLKHGFSFPFFAWKNEDKLYILDGHQRDVALKRLKAQGYEIPPLPIAFIKAKNEKEAREKILLLSSQYGEMTEETVVKFLEESEIDIEDLLATVDLPTVNIEKIAERLEAELNETTDDDIVEHQFQILVECKDEEEQLKLIEKLEKEKYTCRALIL